MRIRAIQGNTLKMADTRGIIKYSVKRKKRGWDQRIWTPIGTDTGGGGIIELSVANGARPKFY
jgi:hypothetical protein